MNANEYKTQSLRDNNKRKMELEITTSFLKILLKFRCYNCRFSSFEVKDIQEHLFDCAKKIWNDVPDDPLNLKSKSHELEVRQKPNLLVVKEEPEEPQLSETMPNLNPELQAEAENQNTLVGEIQDPLQIKTELQEPPNPITIVNQDNLEHIKEEPMDTTEIEEKLHIKPDFQMNIKDEVNQVDTNRDYLGMRFHCKRCDKCYRLEKHANEHLEKCKNISKENVKKIVKDPGCHNCKYCNNCYDKNEPLENHIEVVHHGLRYQCDKCLRTFKHKNLKKFHFCTGSHYTLHPEKLYHCKHCERSYTHEFHLKRHIKSGHVNFHHQCKKCQKEFLNEKNIFFQFCYSCRNKN